MSPAQEALCERPGGVNRAQETSVDRVPFVLAYFLFWASKKEVGFYQAKDNFKPIEGNKKH